jgi:hypothetical protein
VKDAGNGASELDDEGVSDDEDNVGFLESSSIVKDAGDGASELDDEGGGSSAIV